MFMNVPLPINESYMYDILFKILVFYTLPETFIEFITAFENENEFVEDYSGGCGNKIHMYEQKMIINK